MSRKRQRFSRDELESFRGQEVDDLLAPRLRVLFVGINPGLWTAAVNAHFARPGNRFWPALHEAGITPSVVDASKGMQPADLTMLRRLGIGITNLVSAASTRADELDREQLQAGARRLEARVAELRPRVVAVLGLTAYRKAFGRPKAVPGRQSEALAGAELWVLPNPSGLNAHDTVASLAEKYGQAWAAATARARR